MLGYIISEGCGNGDNYHLNHETMKKYAVGVGHAMYRSYAAVHYEFDYIYLKAVVIIDMSIL